MTLKELMLGNIQSNPATAGMQLGAQTQKAANSNNDSAFSDILGCKMSSTDKQSSLKRSNAYAAAGRKGEEPVTVKEDSKPRYLTFREASENNSKAIPAGSKTAQMVKAAEDTNSKLSKAEKDPKTEAVQDSTSNNMIQALVQVLGLDMQELQKLLKEAGITSESFNNMKNLSENVSKLTQLLGLDSEQQDTLTTLLQMAGQTLGSTDTTDSAKAEEQSAIPQETVLSEKAANDTKPTGKAAEVLFAKLQETAGEQETEQPATEIDSLMAKLNAKIKIRLDDLGNRLEKDQSSVEAELKQMLLPLLDKAAVKVQETLQQADTADTGETAAEPVIAAAAPAESTSAKSDDAEQETAARSEKEAAVQQPAAAVKDTQPQTAFTVVQPDKTLNAAVVEKAAAVKTPLDAKEIINQVIEKAKVILTPDKSEMIMDLKPDSLGKISLKVVTENGMVMAKFVAESQQVRQVLESNMQLLKDSLERQGMNVQGFSVSVRQDSDRSAERWAQQDNRGNRSIGGTAYRTSGIEGSLAGAIELTDKHNPYTWGGSTINLTA